MRIIHVSASDMGGAGIAAKRLHLQLLQEGFESKLLTLHKLGEDSKEHYVIETKKKKKLIRSLFNKFFSVLKNHISFFENDLRKYYLKNQPAGFDRFSFPYSNLDIQNNKLLQEADIIHLHWVADGMIDYKSFFENIKKPIVWTLHDMNPFTGGCHHSDGCLEFTKSCVNCLQVKHTADEYIAAKNLSYKLKAFSSIKNDAIRIATPSQWLTDLSSQSILFGKFKHTVIPNITDQTIFSIGNKELIRKELGINQNAFVVLFVANDVSNPRKGIHTLLKVLTESNLENLVVVTIGNKLPESSLPKNAKQFGFITDQKFMARLYSMADVFVLPSMAENFPNTIIESLLCGTPVIANKVGGIPEQVNEKNGILVAPGNSKHLEEALKYMYLNFHKFDRKEIREEAIAKYATEKIIKKYAELYRELKQNN